MARNNFPPNNPRGCEPSVLPMLSLVMIVKDEEKHLPGCLKSAAPWVDEIVVIDTGSTDLTVEIAESFGARVYHHPWQNDFSLHRNQSLSYARGKWLLVLDADEELDQETAGQLKDLMQNREILGYRFKVDDVLPGGGISTHYGPRLFQNLPEIRYTRQVHNQLHIPGAVKDSGVRIIHHGYNLDPANMEKRHSRRISMIKKWAQDEPGNWEAQYYLAQTLVSRPETVEESLRAGLNALSLAQKHAPGKENLSRIYLPLLQSLSMTLRHQEVLKRAGDWAKLLPGHPDPSLFAARAHYALNNPEQACIHAARAWAGYGKYSRHPGRLSGYQVTTGGLLPVLLVIWLVSEWESGRRRRAAEIFKEISKRPDRQQVLKLLLEQAGERGLDELVQQLRPGATAPPGPENAADPVLLSEQAFQLAGQGRLEEAEAAYRQALSMAPGLLGARFNLAVLLARQGKNDQSAQELRACLKQDPSFEPACRMLTELNFATGASFGT